MESRGKEEEKQGTEEASAYGFLKQCLVTTKPSVGLDKPRVGFIQTKHWFYKNQVLVYSKQMLGLSKTNGWFVIPDCGLSRRRHVDRFLHDAVFGG